MKKGVRILTAVLFLASALAGSAWASIRPGAVTLSPMGGGYHFDNDRNLDYFGRMVSLGLGYNFSKYLGTEASIGFIHADSDLDCNDGDVYAYQPRLDLLYYITPDSRFVPYLAAGVSGIIFDDDEISNPSQNPPYEMEDSVQANAGLGVKFFVSEDVALRADARYYYGFNDSESEYALTAGVEFQMGAKAAPEPAPCTDVDNDGICDDVDTCIDVDNDGVCDDRDQCLDTPAGIRVDETGCQIKIEPHTDMEKTGEVPQVIEESDKKPVPEMMQVVVYFDTDKSSIKSLYHKRLAKLAEFMNENPQIIGVIEGHTDSVGTDTYNIRLSERRAESVKNYLIRNHGIDPARFVVKRFGESQPEAPNATAGGRAQNRRVVTITIMGE